MKRFSLHYTLLTSRFDQLWLPLASDCQVVNVERGLADPAGHIKSPFGFAGGEVAAAPAPLRLALRVLTAMSLSLIFPAPPREMLRFSVFKPFRCDRRAFDESGIRSDLQKRDSPFSEHRVDKLMFQHAIHVSKIDVHLS